MQKGFNMFSALVAAILIMTAVVLVSTMTTTEEKMGNQLYYMLNTFQLNDAAAIARSDALQSFNYNFRARMEDYLTFDSKEMDTDPGFSILTTENHGDWGEIVKTFERVILLRTDEDHTFDAVVNFVADRTIDQFYEGSYGRYNVSLNGKDQVGKNNMKKALNEAISCLSPTENFLEIVDCDGDTCETGTFYFNIPLDCISDETYESLPKIVVKDLISNGEVKMPILPKTRLKIYIPLRFFKAIYIAKRNAEAMESVNGLMQDAKLGFCDTGSCSPRTNPNSSEVGGWSGHECPANTTDNKRQTLSESYAGINSYNAGGSTVANTPLNAFVKQKICEAAITNDAGDTGASDFYNINSSYYANDYSWGINGLAPDGTSGINKIDECPFKTILGSFQSAITKNIDGIISGHLYCGKIRQVEADVAFEERNKQYTVTGETIRYKIKITTAPLYSAPTSGSETCTSGKSPDHCG